MDRKFDLAVIGELNVDLILSGDVTPVFGQVEKIVDSATLTLGSSSAIFACGAARLGLKVAFFGKVGADAFGQLVLHTLQERGVDTRGVVIDAGLPTGLTVILSRGADRATLTHLGSISALHLDELNLQQVFRSRHLHIGSYYLLDALRPDLPAIFRQARTQGLSVSLDPNYDPREEWDSGLLDLLAQLDIFLPNHTECRAIARAPDLETAMQKLSQRAAIVVVKAGAEGAFLRSTNKAVRSATLPVEVADTVGAGDSFDAGFLYGYLHGWDLEKCLRLATVCGALSTRKPGGTAAQPDIEEALLYM